MVKIWVNVPPEVATDIAALTPELRKILMDDLVTAIKTRVAVLKKAC